MERLNEKHEGESPKVTLRMDPSMIKVVDREAKRIDGTRSAALRSLVMRATGDGVTAAIGGAMVAQAEVSELKARLEKAEHERDEAITQRKEADRSANRSAKKTMDAWDQARKDLDAAKREREDLITSRNAIALERDTLRSVEILANLIPRIHCLLRAAICAAIGFFALCDGFVSLVFSFLQPRLEFADLRLRDHCTADRRRHPISRRAHHQRPERRRPRAVDALCLAVNDLDHAGVHSQRDLRRLPFVLLVQTFHVYP
jgi:FtsZ-binding cell division protein ZapB